jgi:hypothetical protein
MKMKNEKHFNLLFTYLATSWPSMVGVSFLCRSTGMDSYPTAPPLPDPHFCDITRYGKKISRATSTRTS